MKAVNLNLLLYAINTLEGAGTAGNLTTDAHLAALAIEYDATLCSADNDFARFRPSLRFVNPIA